MKEKSLKLALKDSYRIIAISDIHGHLEVFEDLLDTIQLKAEDHLIIMGDFINKGPNSLKTIHKMMALEERPNTYILKGNHEYFICHYLFNDRSSHKFLNYLKEEHFHNIIHDTVSHGGFDLQGCQYMSLLSQWSLTHYKEEYDYIHHLPVLAFADDMIFVHGGYDKSIDLATEENKLLKFDDFNKLSGINEETVIVGHWPTANLRRNRNTNTPYFNQQKNIITIDGGLGVKSSGELNALIITKEKGIKQYDYLQGNHFENVRIKASHNFDNQEDRTFINFPFFEIEIIEKGETMTLCRHLASGNHLTIFNSLLKEVDGKVVVTTTYINNFLNLRVGQEVELVKTYEDCALVKYKGEFGWVLRHQV